MPTQKDINAFVDQANEAKLKDYYDKCYSSLKDMNKRSNLLSVFILILLSFLIFPTFISETEVIGIKVKEGVVGYLCPLLIPYFILEWCLIARRRRELIKIMKYVGYKVFDIPPPSEDLPFPILQINSRNAIPYSFMIEISNVDPESRVNKFLTRVSANVLLLSGLVFLAYLAFSSFNQYLIPFPMVISNCLGIYCTVRIFLFYINEFQQLPRKSIQQKH